MKHFSIYQNMLFERLQNIYFIKSNGYIRVRNVTGSKMTLKRTSYVYTSNGKRTALKNKMKLKKGSQITVYGGVYKAINGYKKRTVRVGIISMSS